MDFKHLRSFVAVIKYKSFTKAAEKTYSSQPTISTHIRMLEEEFNTRLIIRNSRSIEITPKGWELYECAQHILKLQDKLLQHWAEETQHVIQLGVSTIPSAYILPEILPEYGKMHPESYFVVHQSDSSQIIKNLLSGLFDLGMVGMECTDPMVECVPFYQDRMVLITPVRPEFEKLKKLNEAPIQLLLKEPIILREKGSGSQKSADFLLESLNLPDNELKIAARINDQESIKNLVAGGFGVSIISERAARNFVKERRILMFELPKETAQRKLYLIYPKRIKASEEVQSFVDYTLSYYALQTKANAHHLKNGTL